MERMDLKEHRSIAIDGPSGAGKSTLAKRLAKELGYRYVDTGAIYRTVALAALRAGVEPSDEKEVAALLPGLRVTLDYDGDGLQHMYLNGEDVTEAIRRNEVSGGASKAAAIPAVRAFLLETQRELARSFDVIMDGRDIGTVVLPDADVKIFLTASPEARAERRWKELLERGQSADRDQILKEVMERDARDTGRASAPLRRAEDAVLADTTELDFEGSFRLLLGMIRERLGGTPNE